MSLQSSLAITTALGPHEVENIRRHIDPAWLEEALAATGTASLRRRRLPAEQVFWLVVGMALMRNRPITEVVAKLDLALPGPGGATVVPGALPQARQRLGEEPLQWLFERCAHQWAPVSADRHRWRGLALYGIDGTTMRVPDSLENRSHFQGHRNGSARGESGYPLVRVVALMALRSHLIAAARFGPHRTFERIYAEELLPSLPDNSLTVLDRLYMDANFLISLASAGQNRHWLMLAKKNSKWRVLETFGSNDLLVEMEVSHPARKGQKWTMRAVQYQRKGYQPRWLLTSLLDVRLCPAHEIAQLYHERWEVELGYDEIKTEMLEAEQTLRSQSPSAIRQELWGILLAYNLVRFEMEQVAAEAKVEPTRISFVVALRLIQDEWLWSALASPGAIPRHLRELRASLKLFILPPRRPERVYPRAVKIKKSNYARKLPRGLTSANELPISSDATKPLVTASSPLCVDHTTLEKSLN